MAFLSIQFVLFDFEVDFDQELQYNLQNSISAAHEQGKCTEPFTEDVFAPAQTVQALALGKGRGRERVLKRG